jgi:hypothetical protein
MLLDQSLDLLELSRREPKVASERHGRQPELRGSVLQDDSPSAANPELLGGDVH